MPTDEWKTAAKMGFVVVVAKAVLAPDRSWGEFLGMPVSQPPGNGLQGLGDNRNHPPLSVSEILQVLTAQARPQGQVAVLSSPMTTKPVADPSVIEAGNWRRVVPHPSIVLVLGKRGSGKSALGYRLLELSRHAATPYVVGLPVEARKFLPEWVGMAAALEDVPPKSIALVDEAYLPFHARSSMAAEAKAMSQAVNLSRQREQTIIFVSQEARQVDRNIASSASVMLFKDLGMLQLEFDRPELARVAAQARQAFAAVKGDRRRWAFVYSPDADHTGLVENSLPSFWKEKLSHAFAAAGAAFGSRAPRKTPLAERMERAKALRRQGLSLGQIGRMMGRSKPTIKNYLEDYPYKA